MFARKLLFARLACASSMFKRPSFSLLRRSASRAVFCCMRRSQKMARTETMMSPTANTTTMVIVVFTRFTVFMATYSDGTRNTSVHTALSIR